MASEIPLAKAIASLRSDLETAMAEGDGKHLRLEAGPIELELQAQVSWEGVGETRARWWLLEAGAKASRESASVQTVRLVLTPRLDGAGSEGRVLLAGDDEA